MATPNPDKPVARKKLDELLRLIDELKIPRGQVSIYLELLSIKAEQDEDPELEAATFREYLAGDHQLILDDGEECRLRADMRYDELEYFAKAWKM